MLSDKQLQDIRNLLEESTNPLFFFDDDADGLVAFLLLMKHYQKGNFVCMKVSPLAESLYSKKVEEYHPDLVVVLDRAMLSQETIDDLNVPILWLDHHTPVERKGVHYFNPMTGTPKDNLPTSYWAYRVVRDHAWLAVIGVVSDWCVPPDDLLEHFSFRDMLAGATTPPQMLFDTPYGRLVKVFNFALKGTTTHMKMCVESLLRLSSPLEVLEQTTEDGAFIYKHYARVDKEYDELLQEALSQDDEGKVFVYTYAPAKNSHTSQLSNELLHRVKQPIVIVGRERDGLMKMSLRSKDETKPILPTLKKILPDVEGYGGGHEMACGAAVPVDNFPKFISLLKKAFA